MSSDESDVEDEFWAATVELPNFQVEDHDKNGKRLTAAQKHKFHKAEINRFLREETKRSRATIPTRIASDEVQVQWTSQEDAALVQVLPLNKLRPCWTTVTAELAELCPTTSTRTVKSVRCRWNRLRSGKKNVNGKKNLCSKCGQFKKGHLCPGR